MVPRLLSRAARTLRANLAPRRQNRRKTLPRRSGIESLEPRSLLAGDIAVLIWHDVNGNADKDPEENELPGWTVYLDLNDNNVLEEGEPSLVTDADGEVLFEGLDVGDYVVREQLEPGWSPSPGTSNRQQVTVRDGKEEKLRFGNLAAQVGDIVGLVWNDANGDGVQSATELGLADWTVFLDDNNDGIPSPGEPTALTDANGEFLFLGLQAGEYKIREVLPAGWETSPGYDDNLNVFVTTGEQSFVEFANFTPEAGTIAGTVWNDADGNGIRAIDPGTGEFTELGVASFEVYLDLNGDGVWTTGEPSAISDAMGDYTIFAAPMGTNTLRESLGTSWLPTAPASGFYVVTLPNGGHLDGYDFGIRERQDASIHGTVYVDRDHDGIQDAGEGGLPGITVYLDLDNDDVLDDDEPRVVTSDDLFYTPFDDEAGDYSFTHLTKGTYTIREIVPEDQHPTPETEREHTVTLEPGEDRDDVDCGNVYRPNEIHGVKFEDADGDHYRDAGESGLAGVTVYVDRDRDNVMDDDELRTVTAADGSYAFANLAPGAYVVRELDQEGYVLTFPTTVGGILWPEGTSNPAVGMVNPTSITASLAEGESHQQTVSITLPTTGALTNLVDVFLLFDDTGSFTENSPIVRAAFPEIIAALQTALPGIDLGFGVGRLEEYGGFAEEDSVGRPYILNQPIVASTTPGFAAAIQAALDRTAPGFGGDQPETVFEALYQVVTGAGFDGNDNGSRLDSGAAGLVSTQLTPGNSGDVPPFASFTADPSDSVLPAAGNLGGAGFRAGALPIILTATDTGFAYQPRGETTIIGVGGVTLPVSALTETSRPTTPFGAGAGIQQTITGLNALGALVIGLGTNAESTLDPRQGLEAIATLTGSTNQTAFTIDNGTPDAIAPGDPLYFQIASGFGPSVANGVVAAIQNAVTNVAVNVTVRASDPRVHLVNHTGTIINMGAGDTASFDIEFVGDGIPHRFDLQFVRAGTNVVLGSIPVVLGTPIPGDGYEFEDLEDGEFGEDVDFGNHFGSLSIANVAPSFLGGPNQVTSEDSGPQTVANWALSISPGPSNEAGQQVDFIVTSDNAALFAAAPSVSSDGTLSYTPAPEASGVANVTVRLHDDGGTADGGVDTSAPQSFTITINAVDDPPQATDDSQVVYLNHPLVVAGHGVLSNDSDVDDAAMTAVVESKPAHGVLTLNPDGSFAYTPTDWFAGTDSFTYRASDGTSMSAPATVTIEVAWIPGDLNADGDVNRTDIALLAANYGATPADRSHGDLDGDGAVGLYDVALLQTRLGSHYELSAVASPPAHAADSRTAQANAAKSVPVLAPALLDARPREHSRRTPLRSAAVDLAVGGRDEWLATTAERPALRQRARANTSRLLTTLTHR